MSQGSESNIAMEMKREKSERKRGSRFSVRIIGACGVSDGQRVYKCTDNMRTDGTEHKLARETPTIDQRSATVLKRKGDVRVRDDDVMCVYE